MQLEGQSIFCWHYRFSFAKTFLKGSKCGANTFSCLCDWLLHSWAKHIYRFKSRFVLFWSCCYGMHNAARILIMFGGLWKGWDSFYVLRYGIFKIRVTATLTWYLGRDVGWGGFICYAVHGSKGRCVPSPLRNLSASELVDWDLGPPDFILSRGSVRGFYFFGKHRSWVEMCVWGGGGGLWVRAYYILSQNIVKRNHFWTTPFWSAPHCPSKSPPHPQFSSTFPGVQWK